MRTSVAMATFNGVEYLEEQLESLRRQDVAPDEVLVFDDGSTDGTVELVQAYIDAHALEGWSVRRNPYNLGFAENFHTAARACSGDIVFFCDQDDVWHPEKIARCLEVMTNHPNIELLCSEYGLLCGEGASGSIPKACAAAMTGDGMLEHIPAHNGGVYIWLGCAMTVRRDFLERVEPYWFSGWAHDECVWKLSQASGGCYLLHESLLEHRMHGANVTGHKIHDLQKRAAHLEEKMKGDESAARFAKASGADREVVRVFEQAAKCEALRFEMLSERKPANALCLLRYLSCYQEKKSFLRELLMMVKG